MGNCGAHEHKLDQKEVKQQKSHDQLWPEMAAKAFQEEAKNRKTMTNYGLKWPQSTKGQDLPGIGIFVVLAICFEKVMFLLGNMGGRATGGTNNNSY